MQKRRYTWTLFATFLMLLVAFFVGLILFQLAKFYSLDQITRSMAHIAPYAAALRLGVIGLIAAFWRPITKFIGARYRMSDADLALMYAARWRVVGWLLVIEVVIGEDIINRFILALR